MTEAPIAPPQKAFLKVTLNKDGVTAPAMEALTTAGGTVVLALRAIEEADLSGPVSVTGPTMTFQFEDGRDQPTRKQRYRSWLLAKGFHDLTRGLRLSLEEAFLWIELVKRQGQKVPGNDFQRFADGVRRVANRKNFPDLLADVNSGLSSNLSWDRQFMSLQKARNCLEHRNGIVSQEKDADDGASWLSLSIPRPKMFVLQGEEEVELKPGLQLDGGREVHVRVVTRERCYRVGERIEFSPDDFGEIAFACWIMVSDLANKLPLVSPLAEAS